MIRARIAVVGSCNVDLIWHGDHLPAPGETVGNGVFQQLFGGKGANQACAAAALGAEVTMIGCVGHDPFGASVRADLEASGVATQWLHQCDDFATGTALINVDSSGENTIAVASGANRALEKQQINTALQAFDPDIVIVGFEIGIESATYALQAGHALGAATICNPSPVDLTDRSWVSDTTTIVVNEHEAIAFRGAASLFELGSRDVVITRGAFGATRHRVDQVEEFEAFKVNVVDTTGAGDAFCAALAVSDDPRFACAAAALATRSIGARTALANRDEVELLLKAQL